MSAEPDRNRDRVKAARAPRDGDQQAAPSAEAHQFPTEWAMCEPVRAHQEPSDDHEG